MNGINIFYYNLHNIIISICHANVMVSTELNPDLKSDKWNPDKKLLGTEVGIVDESLLLAPLLIDDI